MSSRVFRTATICSRTASRRSQSTMRRCTSGSGTRRRSARGGKRPSRTTTTAHLVPLPKLVPHQQAVGQQDQHAVPVKTRPQPTLILIPAQQLLGFLVKLLNPMPPVRVLHHPLQHRLGPEVAPIVTPLAIAGIFADQPAHPPGAVRVDTPAPHRYRLSRQPTLAALTPTHRPPRRFCPGRRSRRRLVAPG